MLFDLWRDAAVWNFMKTSIMAMGCLSSGELLGQESLEMRSQMFRSSDGSASVLLLDMVHFGPETYYQNLAQAIDSYASPLSNVVMLLEGVHCRRDTLVLRDHIKRWPFPQLPELEARFSREELLAVRAGLVSPAFYRYFLGVFEQRLAERGLAYYFRPQNCPRAAIAQTVSPAPLQLATQMQSVDDLYALSAQKLTSQTGLASMTQHDRNNPLWQKMFELADRGHIRAIVGSDMDKSAVNPLAADQLLWLARMGIQESNPRFVHGAFDYLSAVWFTVNNQGFRNQIVIDALKAGHQRGHRHFVLPWGASHNTDIAVRLEQLGFRAVESKAIPYAPCTYVRLAMGNESCKMGF